MKRLMIYTHEYNKELEYFAARAKECEGLIIRNFEQSQNGQVSIVCHYRRDDNAFLDGLAALLAEIAQQENPLYRHSPIMRDMADDLRNTQIFAGIKAALVGFLKHSTVLYLEGYVAFRMSEYREKLDYMSYSLIKKMKLIQQD